MRSLASLASILLLSVPFFCAGHVAATEAESRIHTAVTVSLDPSNHRIEASARLKLAGMGPGEPVLELNPALTVERVEIDDEPVDFEVARDKDRQLVTVSHPETLSGEHLFGVHYSGEIHDPPDVARFSRTTIADQTSGTIQAEGVFLPPDAGWYPKVAGSDRPLQSRLSVELPEGWDAVAEGTLRLHEEREGRVHVIYESRAPLPGLHLVAGPWIRIERERRGIRAAVYVYEEDRELAESYLPAVERYLEMYDEWFGPYPYDRFSVVENFFASGYGMPGFTVLGQSVMRLPFIVHTSLGHEVAHAWWGNGVFVDESRGNWCEGLTSYVADYHYKALRSKQDAAEYRREVCRDYTSYVSREDADFPLSEFTQRSTPATRAIGYGKAMMVFHMLRERLGSARFDQALREVYRNLLYRKASWDDWQTAFSRAAGEDLRWFFDQWVERPGAPRLEIADVAAREILPDPRRLRGEAPPPPHVEVTGKLIQRGGEWRVRIPIVLEAGERLFRRTVEAEGPSTPFRLRVPVFPQTLRVDPEQDVFRRLDPLEMPPVLSQVLGDPEALFVMSGGPHSEAYRAVAETLTRTGEGRVIEASGVRPEHLSGRSVFLLGLPPDGPLRKLLTELPDAVGLTEAGVSIEGRSFPEPGAAVLVVGRLPDDPARAIALFWGRSTEGIRQAGHKLVHYGKYSYLAFVDGTNQIKGIARIEDGPLVHRFPGNPNPAPDVE